MSTTTMKQDGTITVKGADGKIIGNIASGRGPVPSDVRVKALPVAKYNLPQPTADGERSDLFSRNGEVVETPGGWAFTRHVIAMAGRKGFDFVDLVDALDNPSVVYAHGSEPTQERRIKGDLCVVVDYVEAVAITAYLNVKETDLRPDQAGDKRAQAYNRTRRSA